MPYTDQHYIDAEGGLHFLSAQDCENATSLGLSLPDPTWVVATPDQIVAALSPTAEKQWTAYQAQAREALDASDVTIVRCVENGVAVPEEWAAYRRALRTIVSASMGTPGTLPVKPAYPAGT
jgi:hypothetical protein